jgi:hypothetical protein
MALPGNTSMLRVFLDRLLPQPPKDAKVEVGPLPTSTPEEMAQSQATVLASVASGRFTPMHAEQIVSLIEASRRVFETQALTQRVRVIEE